MTSSTDRAGTDQAPADPAAPDTALASQPVGYWAGRTHHLVTRHLRDAMARLDVAQPEYWVLNRVHAAGDRPTRAEVVTSLTELTEDPHEIGRTVDRLLRRTWLTADATGRLDLTPPGEAARIRLRALVTEARAVVHDGIDDAEYAVALRVLRRMIANVEGTGGR
ncbi:MarR family transcriptional regulator (plasmid) [Streptomyces sp. BI20]|uniref:MarR family transcriptional regulator n=1 Tax=Streptomyces sp. BI20 TaxID=3403460 RepID=UPI003C70F4BD